MTSPTLDGRVALVTGAGSGLGRAIAQCLSEAGALVIVADIDAAAAEETASLINQAGSTLAEAIKLDVRDAAQADDAIESISQRYGDGFDLLVNNAGIDRGADIPDIDDDQWRQVFATNVDGTLHLSRAFIRWRLGREALAGDCADIVCIASISALTVGGGASAYNASKAALLKLCEVMQTEAREHEWPIRVSVIHPAAMATPMMDQWSLPEERMMDPSIVAGVVRTAVTLPAEAVLQSAVITLRNESYPR